MTESYAYGLWPAVEDQCRHIHLLCSKLPEAERAQGMALHGSLWCLCCGLVHRNVWLSSDHLHSHLNTEEQIPRHRPVHSYQWPSLGSPLGWFYIRLGAGHDVEQRCYCGRLSNHVGRLKADLQGQW